MKTFHSIRLKVLFLGLFPAVLVAFTLAAYFSIERIMELEDSLQRRGQSVASQLAPACFTGLMLNDVALLETAVESSLRMQEVVGIAVRNSIGELIIDHLPTVGAEDRDVAHFRATVVAPSARVNDFADDEDSGRGTIAGEIQVALSLAPTRRDQWRVVSHGALVLLLTIIVTAFFAWRLGRSVAEPITALTEAVGAVSDGHLDTRVTPTGEGELLRLTMGFNAMVTELRAASEDKEQQVNQATAELQTTLADMEIKNIQFDLGRQKALEAAQSKSDFLANMSHEIRTPMNAVLGFAELLRHTSLQDEQRTYVDLIHSSATNLLTLINDVLDFSKLESGKLSVHTDPFQLRTCVDEVVATLGPTAQSKGLELVNLLYSDVPLRLIGNAPRIRQVLLNLIGNAIKFTQSGSVVVRTMLEDEHDRWVTLRFTVQDTGIGIDADAQQRLFTAFTQLDSNEARSFGGTGLGLVICKRLVEAMGGSIGLNSTLGEGSTFWFTLNLEVEPGQEEDEVWSHGLAGRRVLLCEDQAQARSATQHHLLRWNIEVCLCTQRDQLNQTLNRCGQLQAILLAADGKEIGSPAFQGLLEVIRGASLAPVLLMLKRADHKVLDGLSSLPGLTHLPKPMLAAPLGYALRQLWGLENATSAQHPAPMPDLHGKRVLVVDDQENNRLFLAALLTKAGAEVDQEDTGESAIAICGKTSYDLVFMDVHMPGVSGLEATRTIRANGLDKKRLPIIALSANSQREMIDNARSAGMNDYLTKPVPIAVLWKLVRQWIFGEVPQSPLAPVPVTALPPHAELPVYRRDEALAQAGGSQKLADDLLRQLQEEIPGFLQIIESALVQDRRQEARDAVHKLRGALAYCAVPAAQAAALALETALGKEKPIHQTELNDQLRFELERVLTL